MTPTFDLASLTFYTGYILSILLSQALKIVSGKKEEDMMT